MRGDLDRAVDDALSELFENDAVSNRDLEASSSSLGQVPPFARAAEL